MPLTHRTALTACVPLPAGGLGVLGVLLQSQSRAADGYSVANPALRVALDNAPLTPKDPSGSGTFDLASLLPPPRRGNTGASRPYVYYDGARRHRHERCEACRLPYRGPTTTAVVGDEAARHLLPSRLVAELARFRKHRSALHMSVRHHWPSTWPDRFVGKQTAPEHENG